jgi:hypothetical protein
MVTIENLEVRFDVEGESDEAVFARLFERHIRSWHADCEERKTRSKRLEAERSLAGHGSEDQA